MARSVIQAQAASPMFSHVYAALVAIVNTKFPQTGELIAKRLIVRFRRAFRRNDKVSVRVVAAGSAGDNTSGDRIENVTKNFTSDLL